MKKILYFLAIAAATILASCQKVEPVGGTAVQAMSGQWYVTCDIITADGQVLATGEEFFGLPSRFVVLTYNTAENTATDLIFDDLENFWEFKCVTKITSSDESGFTFSATDAEDILNGDTVTLTGKVVRNGGKNASGLPVDTIEVNCTFGSDEYPAKYGYDHYRLTGWRYTGFAADE